MDFEQIPVAKIMPNKENPRGLDIRVDDPKLVYLKDSIRTFGVLVPVVVARKKGGEYLLIDGERRYWAAKSLGLKHLPAYILDQNGTLSEEDILFRMFQIHHNREQWGPVQQCNALEDVFQKISRKSEIRSIQDHKGRIKAIAEELVAVTGIEERTAINRVYFLLWPKEIKKRLYQHPLEEGYWYICEIEEKIIAPAVSNYPEYFQKVPVDEVRGDLFEKLERHSLDKSTDVRKVAPFFRVSQTKESDRKAVLRALSELHKNKDMTFSDAQDELLKHFPDFHKHGPVSPRRFLSMVTALEMAIEDFDFESIKGARTRAKASPLELVTATRGLGSSLEEFLKNLEAYAK